MTLCVEVFASKAGDTGIEAHCLGPSHAGDFTHSGRAARTPVIAISVCSLCTSLVCGSFVFCSLHVSCTLLLFIPVEVRIALSLCDWKETVTVN